MYDEHKKIIQVTPAQGWYAAYEQTKGPMLFVPVIQWALVVLDDGYRQVEGVVLMDDMADLASGSDNFSQYFSEAEMKRYIKDNTPPLVASPGETFFERHVMSEAQRIGNILPGAMKTIRQRCEQNPANLDFPGDAEHARRVRSAMRDFTRDRRRTSYPAKQAQEKVRRN
jgi:hypothetical protein